MKRASLAPLGRLLFAGLVAGLVAGAALAPIGADAQIAGGKTLHMIVPFPPGGPADVLGRVVADGLAEAFQQTAIVDNRTGAAGNIGVEAIARGPADGSTMGIVPAGNIAVNPSLFPVLPYKASELAPVAMLGTVENVLVVGMSVPANNLKELFALATAKPGTLSFASAGAGSQAHLAGELLQLDTGVQMIHVPYKGTGPALTDLIGGQVTMMFAQLSSALPQIRAGKLRAIGIASAKRNALIPDVPTIAEQGVARFEAVSWYALMVPASTPKEVVDRLNAETNKLLARPQTREKLAAVGLDVASGPPEQLARTIQVETARWSEVVRQRHLKPE